MSESAVDDAAEEESEATPSAEVYGDPYSMSMGLQQMPWSFESVDGAEGAVGAQPMVEYRADQMAYFMPAFNGQQQAMGPWQHNNAEAMPCGGAGCFPMMLWMPAHQGGEMFGKGDSSMQGYQHQDGFMPPYPSMKGARGGRARVKGEAKPSQSTQNILHKQRFCATYPNIEQCHRGENCAFAHSREEVGAPLLSIEEELCLPVAMTNDFFTDRYKVYWCPVGTQHDWQHCMYAHTYQDVRRPPSIGYGRDLCPYWRKKETTLAYAQRCPLGPRCSYAHGAKEQLYHPSYFRTHVCRDLQRRRCPRSDLCAFYHHAYERRDPQPFVVDYSRPLSSDAIPQEWLTYFLSPPHFQEGRDMGSMEDNSGPSGDQIQEHPVSRGGRPYAPFWLCNGETTFAPRRPIKQSCDESGDEEYSEATLGDEEAAEHGGDGSGTGTPTEQFPSLPSQAHEDYGWRMQ
eukprot:TRINITY_DN11131_c0_g1_i1.p2 TRINITY_DN11131_c0_g1~~TRINITY_DN11131_c0_g1_i1.p2  ORF type:complete len:457 (+),score=52.57 TRINITY_DN11131_c0_g1_i1:98-1468(+)